MHKSHKSSKIHQQFSLPSVLCTVLKQHAQASDIPDDEELKEIVTKLESLNGKVEEVKAKALANRQKHQANK